VLHVLNDSSTGSSVSETFSGTSPDNPTSWSGTLSEGTEYSHCYNATLSATGSHGSSNRASTGTVCAAPPPPPPPPPPPEYSCDDCTTNGTPIVINLGSGPYRLSGIEDSVRFDLDGDGVNESISWTARDTAMAFLFLDHNGNGIPDSGAELFGNHISIAGRVYANGFAALEFFDSDHNGVIDARDPIWQSLGLWIDGNHDAVASTDEIIPLDASNIRAIDTRYHLTGRIDQFGNAFRYESLITTTAGARPVYDVIFRTAP
jgi:hypothetical protein